MRRPDSCSRGSLQGLMVSETECLICQVSTSCWAVWALWQFFLMSSEANGIVSLRLIHFKREILWAEQDELLLALLLPSASWGSASNIHTPQQSFSSTWELCHITRETSTDRPSRSPWGSTSPMTAATLFLRLLTGGAASVTWKSHAWTMYRLLRQNPWRLRHRQLVDISLPWTLRTGPLVVTLYGVLKVPESKSYKTGIPWLEG